MILKGLASSNTRRPHSDVPFNPRSLMLKAVFSLSATNLNNPNTCLLCQNENTGGSVCPSGSTYCELPYLENIFLVPKPNTNKHPEFSCNWKNFKCMLLREQSCDVPAFTYCIVVLPAATSRPPSSTFHYNHIDTYLTSINPLLMWHPHKAGTGNIKALVKSDSCAFVLHRAQWKVAEIILILKPRKSNKWTSYLPTSLLPTVSKGPLKKGSSQWLKMMD
jgi:hypothetical protein